MLVGVALPSGMRSLRNGVQSGEGAFDDAALAPQAGAVLSAALPASVEEQSCFGFRGSVVYPTRRGLTLSSWAVSGEILPRGASWGVDEQRLSPGGGGRRGDQ